MACPLLLLGAHDGQRRRAAITSSSSSSSSSPSPSPSSSSSSSSLRTSSSSSSSTSTLLLLVVVVMMVMMSSCLVVVSASPSKRASSSLHISKWDANVLRRLAEEESSQQQLSPDERLPAARRYAARVDRAGAMAHDMLIDAEVEQAPDWVLESHAAIANKIKVTMPNSTSDGFFQGLGAHGPTEDTTEDHWWSNDRPHDSRFFLPSDCPTSERACCLSYQGEVCGGSTRGTCVNMTVDSTYCAMTKAGRIGMWWFTDYFDMACACNGNYYGAACEECAMGWEGDDCNTKSEVRVRRDFSTLSDIDKQYTVDAFRLAKVTPHPFQPNVSLFDWWAVLHRWALPGAMDAEVFEKHPEFYWNEFIFGHVGTGALTYHRTLVNGIERALQIATGNYSFSLPYWNWTHSAGNDNDETLYWFGGDGSTDEPSVAPSCRDRTSADSGYNFAECTCPTGRGPFAFWPIISDWGYPLRNDTTLRGFGCNTLLAPSLPSQATSDCSIVVKTYENMVGSDGSRGGTGLTNTRRLLASSSAAASNAHADADADADADLDAATLANAVGGELSDEIVRTLRTPERVRVQRSDPAHDDDDEVMWSFPFPVFHNLLGGGAPCRQARTWPNAIKFSDMHERAHRWLSGTMIFHHPASDPLFWMLHSFADLILEQWIRNAQYNGRFSLNNSWAWVGENYGNGREDCQGPMFPLRRQRTMFNDTLNFGVDWDFFLNNPPNRYPYAISEPTVQAYFFDGTDNFLWMDRSDYDNPTVAEQLTGSMTYYLESVSSFSGSDSLLADEVLNVPHASDSSIETPLDLRFLQSYLCNSTADCCPVSGALNETCGGSTRGSCVSLSSDDDLWWLTAHYSSVCKCNGNYDGVACETCAFGYEGSECSVAREANVRREFSSLGGDDRQYVIDAFRTAKIYPSRLQPAVSILDFYAAVHFAMQWPVLARDSVSVSAAELAEIITSGGGQDINSTSYLESPLRTGGGALTYYRALLLHLEQEMQAMTANASFAIPYWDWTNAMENDNDETLRWFGGDGSTLASIDSPLCRRPTFSGKGGCTCQVERVFKLFSVPTLWAQTHTNVTVQRSFQCLGRIAPSLPSKEVSTYALSLDSYYSEDDNVTSFARYLTGLKTETSLKTWPSSEGPDMQQRVFNWLGGTSTTMELADYRSAVSNAAADPLFWLVTAYTDSLLEQWMRLRADASDATTLLPTTTATTGLNADQHIMAIVPLTTNAHMFVTSTKLGYTYDRL